MTREEAKDILEQGRPHDGDSQGRLDEFDTALSVAIEALEQDENALIGKVLEAIESVEKYKTVWDKVEVWVHKEELIEAVESLKGGKK